MFTKLESLSDRYRELSEAIAQPEVIQDFPRYQACLKERSSLEPVVEKYEAFRRVEQQIQDNRELLSDPLFASEAEKEIADLDRQRENLIADLKLLLVPPDPLDSRNVIIQLNEPIIGCTTAENYEFHTLSGEVIPVTSAVSAFQEIGGEAPNVFRLTTGKDLQVGTTYVVETRGMSWNGKPCQGTIAYITP